MAQDATAPENHTTQLGRQTHRLFLINVIYMNNSLFSISNFASLSNLCHLIYTYISFLSGPLSDYIMFSNNYSLSKKKKKKEPWANTMRWWLKEQKEDNSTVATENNKLKERKGGRDREERNRERKWMPMSANPRIQTTTHTSALCGPRTPSFT